MEDDEDKLNKDLYSILSASPIVKCGYKYNVF